MVRRVPFVLATRVRTALLCAPGVASHEAAQYRSYGWAHRPAHARTLCRFLAWLLLFNAAYCCIGGPVISLGRPRLCWMVAAGLLGGMLQYVLSHRFEMTSFALMPITFGSLPADMIFFTSGVVARRNGWLDGDSSLRECTHHAQIFVLLLPFDELPRK